MQQQRLIQSTWLRAAAVVARYIFGLTRPLRFECPGALYHVTARGDRRNVIFCDDADRHTWLRVLRTACSRFNFIVHAFCQMTNHYHLLIESVDGNLAGGLRQLNGVYAQYFNGRHGLVEHVFQGRYKAILMQKESYLLELSRYIVLNPLLAGLVASHADWCWSSYHFIMRVDGKPAWLERDWLLARFGPDLPSARAAYDAFILQGRGLLSPLRDVQHQVLLGDKAFVSRCLDGKAPDALADINRMQRRAVALSLEDYDHACSCRNEAMARAYRSTATRCGRSRTIFKLPQEQFPGPSIDSTCSK